MHSSMYRILDAILQHKMHLYLMFYIAYCKKNLSIQVNAHNEGHLLQLQCTAVVHLEARGSKNDRQSSLVTSLYQANGHTWGDYSLSSAWQ